MKMVAVGKMDVCIVLKLRCLSRIRKIERILNYLNIRNIILNKLRHLLMATWPSGYGAGFRLCFPILPVRKSEGSNPSVVILFWPFEGRGGGEIIYFYS